jgi:hypothetical protein
MNLGFDLVFLMLKFCGIRDKELLSQLDLTALNIDKRTINDELIDFRKRFSRVKDDAIADMLKLMLVIDPKKR